MALARWKFYVFLVVILMLLSGCLPVPVSGSSSTGGKNTPLPKSPATSTVVVTHTPEATSTPTSMNNTTRPTASLTTITPSTPAPMTLLAAGDIADCENEGDEETAALLAGYPDAVIATLGDTVYEAGSASEFSKCYDPTWGQAKDRTRPAVGNHEYLTPGAVPYYSYFGDSAGDPENGYYSYDLGQWHIIVLNSNCSKAGGCKEGRPQLLWLAQDLKAHPSTCSLAYWHHPRFSSGQWGNTDQMEPIWRILYKNGVELVLSGHDHDYERFQPIGLNGTSDPDFGIRQFVVGTGGKNLGEILSNRPLPLSEVTNDDTYGLLKLTLMADSYHWEFLPVEGGSFTDSGQTACHQKPA